MLFTDRITFDHPRKTADGYLVVRARAARAGIYEYLGSEVDPQGEHGFAANDTVKVYRPEEEVFSADSVASFLMKPVTNDHPSQPVTAANWRDYAKGVVGKALRDGDFLAFDIVLMDKDTIAAVEDGKRELSNGYASTIEFTDGSTETGEHFDAIQKNIRGNHVAIVKAGRAGPLCRIGDAATCAQIPASELIEILTDGQPYNPASPGDKNEPARRETSNSGGSQVATKTITFDGLPLEVTDAAEAAITKLQTQLKDERARAEKAEGDLAAALKDKSTLEGEKAALETKLKDAEVSPEKLEKMVADRAALVATAKAVDPNVVTDGKTEAEIRKAVVEAKLGDAAKALDDAGVAGAFAALSKDAKADQPDALRDTLRSKPIVTADASAVRDLARASQY
jgi:hypothetical protein